MRFVPASRQVLAEVLLAAGPTAATLCAGWETRHLAAHLVLREHSPLAAGILVRQLAQRMERELENLAAEALTPAGFATLVRRFEAGPGRFSPLAIPPLDQATNLMEYFIHTEDVRRASDRWVPRALDARYSELLWRNLIGRAALMYRGSDVGIILVRPDGIRHVVRKAGTSVAISGAPSELVLHASGRGAQALVTFEGSPEAIALLATAHLSL
ncbi:TIGR03085 family metal-binding protein [Paeniglutamicibacter cryotolerans]|uniref:Uncharacterized protein (TIGR03085 family) n=1 Tax=Paeniglutamicibacter cryotolerans TaxID=670079 RepID=A0A839QXS0_9MICC|nr:TIGR03085 family metal-binding protein [Paeniglutamicibacter cryotolerans]MBB2996761.1 uncharacterized protein (TIGR03085 family) [Paeniglutamicibacter cryotolerans]